MKENRRNRYKNVVKNKNINDIIAKIVFSKELNFIAKLIANPAISNIGATI